MATILLVEPGTDLRFYEAGLLEDLGHDVVVCRGAPGGSGTCPLMRDGACSIAEDADLIVVSTSLHAPVGPQPHRGAALLRRYREHPRYGSKPCVVVSLADPGPLPGTGEVAWVPRFSPARAVVDAVTRLLGEHEHGARTRGG